ncbi:MAG: SDR family oxidoreductase [Hyphomicrobiales bacterium]
MAKPVIIITGGSRGIGAACTRLAAERGYAVCVNYNHDAKTAKAIVAQITGAGGTAIAVKADISRKKHVRRLFETTDKELGALSVLVNNAGVLGTQSRLDEISAKRFDRVFATNVRGTFLCVREAVKRMSTLHGGTGGAIVNVSSRAAVLGSPGEYVDYAASKGAVDTLTIGLAREVAGEGIRVNAVRPGFIYTDIHASGGEPNRVDRIGPTLPMGRGGTADEVANAVLWLASDEASYSTGALIDVSGGR